MSENAAPSPLPVHLELAADLLEPRGFMDWQMSPWLSEKLQGVILPLQVEDQRLLVTWDGLATVRLFRDGSVRLQGRTGAFGSVLSTVREGSRTTVRGFHDDRTLDYTVDEHRDEIRVEGDTGRFRSRYLVKVDQAEVVLAGDHGEFDSNFAARFEPGLVHMEGTRSGERVDCRVTREANRLRLEGLYQGSHADLALDMAPGEWVLSGFLQGETVRLAIREGADGLEFTGTIPPQGVVHFTLSRTEDGFWIRGKANNFHLNYRLITTGKADRVGAVVGAAKPEAAEPPPADPTLAEAPPEPGA